MYMHVHVDRRTVAIFILDMTYFINWDYLTEKETFYCNQRCSSDAIDICISD